MKADFSVRVNTGIKRIEVNDKGEYIEISLNNAKFFDEFGELVSWLSKKQEDLNALPEPAEDDAEGIAAIVCMRTGILKELAERLDRIFGAGACKKIFGDIIPDEVLVADFLEQITPFVEQLAKERNQKLNDKYNRNRGIINGGKV